MKDGKLVTSSLVEKLIEKAANAEKSEDAMRFSQAATNAANAMCALNVLTGKMPD